MTEFHGGGNAKSAFYCRAKCQTLIIQYRKNTKALGELKLCHDLCTQSLSNERLCQKKYERISCGYGGFIIKSHLSLKPKQIILFNQ